MSRQCEQKQSFPGQHTPYTTPGQSDTETTRADSATPAEVESIVGPGGGSWARAAGHGRSHFSLGEPIFVSTL